MSSVPHSMDRDGIQGYAKYLAGEVRATMKRKHGSQWGEKPVPWHQRVGSPFKHHDDEPVWYDPKKHPVGSVIKSEAPDLLTGHFGTPPPGTTKTVQKRDRNGEPVFRERRVKQSGYHLGEKDGSTIRIPIRGYRIERVPVMVRICCHSGKPYEKCCPWIKQREQERAARDKKAWAAEDRARRQARKTGRKTFDLQPSTCGVVRGDTITTGRVTKCTGIDPYGRTIVGTPGQLRAEARRHGKYISKGPGAE